MKHAIYIVPALLALAACGQPRATGPQLAGAANAAESGSEAQSPADARQQAFLEEAYRIHAFAIKTGEMAYQRSDDPQVRALGLKAANEHKNWLNRLERIADENEIRLDKRSAALSGYHAEALDELLLLEGDEFDRRFVAVEQEAQTRAKAWFAQSGGDASLSPDFSDYSASIQPVLGQLETLAHSIGRSMA